MLPTIKELREAAGGLSNLTDEEIISATFPSYQQYYGSVDDFAKSIGYGGAGRGLAGSRVSAGVDTYQSNLYGLGGAVARKAGLDGVASWMDEGRDRNEQAAQYAQQRARDLGGIEDWREVDGVGSGLNYLGGLAAQSLPYLGEAVAGGLTGGVALTGTAARLGLGAAARGAARTAGATAASYPSAVGDILSAQREAGGEDLGSAALGGVPYAALNAFGVEGLAARGLRPLAAGQGGMARRMATGAATTSIGEGLGETGQELTNQYFGRMAVDPNETLFNDEANTRYLDSFVGGAALGGVFGGAGGIRRPRTVDEGQFDLTGNGNQPQYNLTTEMDPIQGRINQNLGLQRTPLRDYEKQFLEAFNEPSGRFVSDPQTGVERELTAGEVQQMQLGELQAQKESTAQREQQIAQETLLETSKALGVTPAANLDNAYDVLGARVYGQSQVAKIVQEVAVMNSQLPPEQQQLSAAILGANLVNLGGSTALPTAKKIANAVTGKIKQLQLEGVDSVERAAEILNDQVATLVAAGKNEGDVKLGQIATVYERLTGQTPPALAAAPAAPAATTAAPVVEKQQPKFQRAPAPEGQTNGQPSAPAGAPAPSVAGRSPVVPGGVVDPGRNAAVDAGVGGDAGVAGPAAQQAAPVPSADVQQPAAVKPIVQNASMMSAHPDYEGEILAPARQAVAANNSARITLKNGAVVNLVVSQNEDNTEGRVIALDKDGKEVGQLMFTKAEDPDGSRYNPHVSVNEELRRGGLATAMYDLAEANGALIPSVDQPGQIRSEEGDAFRNARAGRKALPAPAPAPASVAEDANPVDALLAKHFDGDARKSQIAKAYLSAIKLAPKGSKGQVVQAIAKQFSIKPVTVRKYGNTTELRATAASMGLSPEQIEALDLPDNTKEAPKAKIKLEPKVRADGVTELPYVGPGRNADKNVARDPAKTQAMAAAGFETAEDVESSGFGGMDESNTWKQGREGMGDTENSRDEAKANEIASLMEQQDALRNLIEEYEQEGQTDLIESVQAQVETLQSKLDASLKAYEDYLKGKAKTTSAKVTKDTKKAAKAKAAPVAEEAAPAFENAADAWNEVADSMGSAFPQFQDLSAADQETFTEFGPENWTRQDVIKFAQDTGGDFEPVSFQSRSRKFFDFNDLTDDTGTSPQGADWLDGLGISHAMDYVSEFESYEDFDPEAESGEIVSKGGRYTMRLNTAALSDPEYAAETVTHEIAHAVDMAPHGGIYSSQFEMSVVVKDGAITPVGPVARELYKLYETNESWREYMEYPFDTDKFPEMDNATVVEAEIFAQLFSLYANPRGRAALERRAPVSAAFMKEVITHVKSTRSLQIQTGQTAATRTLQFKNRNAAQGAAVGQQAGGRTGQARLASRSTQGASKGLSVPPAVQPKVDLLTRTLRTGADAALNKIVFSEDLFKRASKMGLTAAMDMDRIYRERAALTGNIEREVTRIENLFNRIPEAFKGTGPRSANQFLYDSTRENKWGFTPTWRGADASKVKVDSALAARYNALPKEARAWVSAVLQHGDKMLKMKKDTLIASTNSEYDALIADAKQRGEADKAKRLEADKAASLRQFQRLFATTEFNPYAPMRRFGDFVVIAKSQKYLDATPAERTKLESDPDHYHVSFAESRASALELERQLKDQGSFSEVSARAKEEARGDMYGGLMDAFNKLRQNIESELGNATEPKEIAALRAARETVAELYLQSLAENSARKAEMRRRGVAGEIDMLRSFSTQGRADAHFLASAKYNPQASEAVVKMRQQAKEGGSQLEKSDAFKEIMARHTQSMRYEQGGWFDVAANTSRVTSIWMLATNPMYYLQNMTQPFVLSLPFMTGKHNWTDASGQLMRAYFQLGDLLKGFKSTDGFDFTKVSKDKAEQDMILKLVDRGRIDIGMDTELGQVKLEGDNVVGKAANRTDQVLRSLSQKVEAVNRVSTALAAYRLEIKAGRTPAQALEYADQVISQTHGDYSRINAPRLFNTPGGKVALQFRKFQLIQLTLLSKLFYNSFANSNKTEKAAARKILAYTLAHTGVLAGVVGMPGFAAVAFIANKLADLFGDDDEPYNLENELRKMLGGGDVARLVMRGAPTLAGADLSGKLGMGNALSILPYTDFDATREGFNAIATGLTLGATGGLGARVFQALGDIKDGDYYRGLMGLSPTGVSQAMKAFVEAGQGETNKRGDVLVSADEIGTFETFAKMIGFPTSAGAERRFDRQVAYDNKEAFEDKSAKLKNEYTKAVRSNDADARRAAIEKWNRLQASRKEAGFTPQPLSSLMKAPQEQAKRERNTAGGVQFNTQNRQFVQEQTAN